MFDRPGEFGELFECIRAELFRPEVHQYIHHSVALQLIRTEEEDPIVRLQLIKHHWEKSQQARKLLTQRETDAAWEFVKRVIDDLEELEELEGIYGR